MAVLLLVLAPLAAQVTPVAGTGCGTFVTRVVGGPVLGGQVTFQNPVLCLGQFALVAVGLPTLLPWLDCAGGLCPIGVDPVATTAGIVSASATVVVPVDPQFVGFCFVAQSACLSITGCANLQQAVQVCVQ